MRRLGAILFVGFFACVLVGMVGVVGVRLLGTRDGDVASAAAVESGQFARSGEPTPLFSAKNLHGEMVNLADYRGKLVVLNFWATWCGPCRSEMPAIEAASERYRGQPVVFVGVNVQESAELAAKFVEEFKLTFSILLDPSGTVSGVFRVRSLPSTFFIDQAGILREQFTGEMNASVIDRRVRLYAE